MPTSKLFAGKRIILGIDPGFADMGYGLIALDRPPLYITCDNVSTKKNLSLPDRLMQLEKAITTLIDEYHPDLIAVEKIFFFKNQKTVIDVAQARGVIILQAARHHIPLVEYTPLEIKQSLTSYGHATKYQVGQMVKTLLNLKTLPKKDDAIDALAIALCAHFRTKTLR